MPQYLVYTTMLPIRFAGIASLLLVSSNFLAQSQQAPRASAPRTATIRFIAEINPQTISSLIEQVEANIRQGVTDITLNITSGGGDPVSAIAAYQYLKGRPVALTTHNFGSTASAAVILFAAGTKRYSTPLGSFIIHEAMANPVGSQTTDIQLNELASILKLENEQMATILSEVTGKSRETTTAWLKNRTVWNAKQAMENKLIQSIKDEISSDKTNTASIVGSGRGQEDIISTTDILH